MALLTMRDITKSFGDVPVLKGVSLSVERGEVHALLGENGAGKSTLMNILAGVLRPDGGTISFDGTDYPSMTVNRSQDLGIAFVHQELNLFNDLTVAENLFLGHEYRRGGVMLDMVRMVRETREYCESLGMRVDPNARVESLKPSERQLLEIARAMFFHVRLLILDEPTTALNTDEIERLFALIRKARQAGTSFIFISHKMPEIMRIADVYTVLRDGRFVGSGSISQTSVDELTSMMVGESLGDGRLYRSRKTGTEVLRLRDFAGISFHGVNLSVGRGQIIGVTGLQGAGSEDFLRSLFGAAPSSGEVIAFGRKVRRGSIRSAMNSGLAMLPADRKETSVLPDLNVRANLTIAAYVRRAWPFGISAKRERETYERYRDVLDIKAAGGEGAITGLSGGNQQKVFLARWLDTGAGILLLDNPTQGVDVGAKEEIYRLILDLADQGKTILINTLDIAELRKVADRCAVFYDGNIVAMLDHDEIQERQIMLYSTGAYRMTGGNHEQKHK
ncbi:sugar ABC transporter ATP-binding protein [Bifidobacterium simiarum]|uniref:sugar ABC transporter ATP-binding protein n=1 Tax=Bifidobacterium simiarum TaxID=2045441 RepID=UPI001BDCC4E5|nr:sugar ABC transporter ATP-binding protein [Bifidobacterium simiarum]MBT1166370.1 sugar ABC transporter ATP-binding protein [Bifidobacterium simiarum]